VSKQRSCILLAVVVVLDLFNRETKAAVRAAASKITPSMEKKIHNPEHREQWPLKVYRLHWLIIQKANQRDLRHCFSVFLFFL
jgi:hypothetical protein